MTSDTKKPEVTVIEDGPVARIADMLAERARTMPNWGYIDFTETILAAGFIHRDEVVSDEMVAVVATILSQLPVRDGVNLSSELDTLRRREAARACLQAVSEKLCSTPTGVTAGAYRTPDEIRLRPTAEDYVHPGFKDPYIVCAACRWGDFVIASARHFSPVMGAMMTKLDIKHPDEQGFIDQYDRFWSRDEALTIMKMTGQTIKDPDLCAKQMFSAGLY